MFVSFTSSDYYSTHTGVALYSLLANNKDSREIGVFILDIGITEENKNKLLSIVEGFKEDGNIRTLTFIKIDEEKIKGMLCENIPIFIGSFATYARLCGPRLYPDYVDKIFIIDSDIVIKGSLKSLYESDMSGVIVAAAPVCGDPAASFNEQDEEYKIIVKNKQYINAGFMLLNIAFWKEIGFDAYITESANNMKDFTFFDQSILNNALKNEWFTVLPYKYNYFFHNVPPYLMKSFLKKQPPDVKEQIKEGHYSPVVVHFPGDVLRPWFKENISSMSRFYDEYKAETPFKDVPKESIFDRPKYKNANVFAKLFLKIMFKTYKSVFGYPFYLINEIRMRINEKKIKKGKLRV